MAQTVEQAIAQTKLYTDDIVYALIKLPPQAITVAAGIIAEIGEAFCALIVDRDEVTLLVPQEALEDFAARLRGQTLSPDAYRLITLDVELEFTLVGFMAHISRALADAGVFILPYAAFTRDHIFVRVEQFAIAWNTLEKMRKSIS